MAICRPTCAHALSEGKPRCAYSIRPPISTVRSQYSAITLSLFMWAPLVLLNFCIPQTDGVCAVISVHRDAMFFVAALVAPDIPGCWPQFLGPWLAPLYKRVAATDR